MGRLSSALGTCKCSLASPRSILTQSRPRTARPGTLVVESRPPEATIDKLRVRPRNRERLYLVGRTANHGLAGRAETPRRCQATRDAWLRRWPVSACRLWRMQMIDKRLKFFGWGYEG